MSHSPDFAKLVPGFEFLQNLVKNAGAALPNVGQWVAPTLDPDELDKRIGELRTVQFWLEQNAAMLGTTIQALEVQRMTLATLKTMNVQMTDLRDALTIRMPDAAPAAAAAAASPPAPEPARAPAASASPAGAVDPMQWWSALTRQFTELAASTLRESAADATGAAGAAQAAPAAAPPAASSARKAAKKVPRQTAVAKPAASRRRKAAGA